MLGERLQVAAGTPVGHGAEGLDGGLAGERGAGLGQAHQLSASARVGPIANHGGEGAQRRQAGQGGAARLLALLATLPPMDEPSPDMDEDPPPQAPTGVTHCTLERQQ